MMRYLVLIGVILAAMLGQGVARDKLVASEFDRDYRDQRDKAASNWVEGSRISRVLSSAKLDRKVALFLERDRDGNYRAFLKDFPRSSKTWYWEIGIGEEELIRKTRTYEGSGLKLLFAEETRRNVFTAIWVPTEFFEEFGKELEKLGVSPAVIKN